MNALGDRAWPEVALLVAEDKVLTIALGATEQHGPHLPLSTDTDIANALVEALAARCEQVVVGPAMSYGASGEHAAFAGTLSIGQEAIELVLVELCRSAAASFERVLLVCAHGGNAEPLSRAVATLRSEGRDVRAWAPRWHGDAHAGRVETSIMLAIAPTHVRMEKAQRGAITPIAELLPQLRAGGVRAVSENGVLGDPVGATAEEGRDLLEIAGLELDELLATWVPLV